MNQLKPSQLNFKFGTFIYSRMLKKKVSTYLYDRSMRLFSHSVTTILTNESQLSPTVQRRAPTPPIWLSFIMANNKRGRMASQPPPLAPAPPSEGGDLIPSNHKQEMRQHFTKHKESFVTLSLPDFRNVTFLDPSTAIFAYRKYIGIASFVTEDCFDFQAQWKNILLLTLGSSWLLGCSIIDMCTMKNEPECFDEKSTILSSTGANSKAVFKREMYLNKMCFQLVNNYRKENDSKTVCIFFYSN